MAQAKRNSSEIPKKEGKLEIKDGMIRPNYNLRLENESASKNANYKFNDFHRDAKRQFGSQENLPASIKKKQSISISSDIGDAITV